jgi:hypothetical protein
MKDILRPRELDLSSDHRRSLSRVGGLCGQQGALHRVMPAVNVAFFTLAGASLKLDALAATAHVAVVIFLVRTNHSLRRGCAQAKDKMLVDCR